MQVRGTVRTPKRATVALIPGAYLCDGRDVAYYREYDVPEEIMPHWLRVTAGCLFALAVSGPAVAQYPNKHITIIVPFAAGGPTDVVARLLGNHMSRTLGQTLV